MQLSDLVAGELVTANHTATAADLAELMEGEAVGSVAIMDENDEFVGLVTDRDMVAIVASGDFEATAESIMTATPDTVDIDTEVSAAVAWLNATGYRHLPVTRAGVLVGMVSIKDLLWAISGA